MTFSLSRTLLSLVSLSLLLTAACGGGGQQEAGDQPAADLVALCNGQSLDFGGETPLNQIAYFAQETVDGDYVAMDPARYPLNENRTATLAANAQYALCVAITSTEELETCDNNGTDVPRYSVTHTATLYRVPDGDVVGEAEAGAVYAACPEAFPEGVTGLYPLPNMPEINQQVNQLIEDAS